MKTKTKIIDVSRDLFNRKGFRNVTLREVAQELNISYGNVTYHFKTKHELIVCLYEEMLLETKEIIRTLNFDNLLSGLLEAPKTTFDISLKYLFFYVDFIEIKRSYIDLAERLEQDNSSRKTEYLQILHHLKSQGLLRKELTNNDLEYLMELSGAMRTFFFIKLKSSDFFSSNLKYRYVSYINKLIYPYLSKQGLEMYNTLVD